MNDPDALPPVLRQRLTERFNEYPHTWVQEAKEIATEFGMENHWKIIRFFERQRKKLKDRGQTIPPKCDMIPTGVGDPVSWVSSKQMQAPTTGMKRKMSPTPSSSTAATSIPGKQRKQIQPNGIMTDEHRHILLERFQQNPYITKEEAKEYGEQFGVKGKKIIQFLRSQRRSERALGAVI